MDPKVISTGIPFTRLPESYVRPESDRPKPSEVEDCDDVPIIDLGSGDRPATVQRLGDACRVYGFFQVINHGVSMEAVEKMLEVANEFFRLPVEEKMKLYSDDPSKTIEPTGSSVPAPKRARVVVQTRPGIMVVDPAQPEPVGSSRGKGKAVETGSLTASQEMIPPPADRIANATAAASPNLFNDPDAAVKFVVDSVPHVHDTVINNTSTVELIKAEYHHVMQTVLLMRGISKRHDQLQRDLRMGRQEVVRMRGEAAHAKKTIANLTAELEALKRTVEEKDAELLQKGIEMGEIVSKAVQDYKESNELQEQFAIEYINGFEAFRSAAAAEYPDQDFSRFETVDD